MIPKPDAWAVSAQDSSIWELEPTDPLKNNELA
jgi:hypothetical protein